ncbi:MAG: exodeoxyribonuclease VII small subunit [Pyrinomonadaceae bacterium]
MTMEKTFEASLSELEMIVGRLEDGDLPLEESLVLFEKGVTASRECRERLNSAQRRIEVLIKNSDGIIELNEIPGSTEPNVAELIDFDDDDDIPF